MNEPTDTAIDTLILEHGVMGQAWPTQRQLHAFARAVHAKWGTPAPVGGEPLTEAEANVLWAQCLTKYKRPGPAELIREFCNGGKGGA